MSSIYQKFGSYQGKLSACVDNLTALRNYLAFGTAVPQVSLFDSSSGTNTSTQWTNVSTDNGQDGDSTLYSDGGIGGILRSIMEALPFAESVLFEDLTSILNAFERLGFRYTSSSS